MPTARVPFRPVAAAVLAIVGASGDGRTWVYVLSNGQTIRSPIHLGPEINRERDDLDGHAPGDRILTVVPVPE